MALFSPFCRLVRNHHTNGEPDAILKKHALFSVRRG